MTLTTCGEYEGGDLECGRWLTPTDLTKTDQGRWWRRRSKLEFRKLVSRSRRRIAKWLIVDFKDADTSNKITVTLVTAVIIHHYENAINATAKKQTTHTLNLQCIAPLTRGPSATVGSLVSIACSECSVVYCWTMFVCPSVRLLCATYVDIWAKHITEILSQLGSSIILFTYRN